MKGGKAMSGHHNNGEIHSKEKNVYISGINVKELQNKDSDRPNFNTSTTQGLDCHSSIPSRPKEMQTSQNRTSGGGVLNLHPNVLRVLS